MEQYYLDTRYDNRQSFYGKAIVAIEGNKRTLLSYMTPVCEIENGQVTLLSAWDYSPTTLRHVKEFLQQQGFKAYPKCEMTSHYPVNYER